MQLNKIYIQRHRDCDIYCMPTRPLKAGGFFGLVYRDTWTGRYGGKATKESLRNWFPVPELATDIPPAVLKKFDV